MTTYARPGRGVVLALLVALAVPATALADAPVVTTGGASAIGQDVATLKGKINPKGNNTSAFFQYGTSRIYGGTTPVVGLGNGNTAVPTQATQGGLAPFTTYHYRLVGQYGSSNKLVFGKDRTFKTKKQPLGLTIAASPTRVRPGGSTTITGTLSGTGSDGEMVQLQSQPFGSPAFDNVGNPQVVQSSGTFSFPVLDVFVNTSFRVLVPNKPEVPSPIVGVEVPVHVFLNVGKKVRKGHKLKFRGRVTPVNENAPVEIQRKFHGTWITVARTSASDSGAGSSFFHKKVKVRRSGRYRALVTPGGAYVANVSRVHRIRLTH
jgi:hypothetical protein